MKKSLDKKVSIINNPNKTDNDLRNIIRAASLIGNTPKTENADIVRICYLYIRLGEESDIPELCDLLYRYGDKTLAEDYVNCDNIELKSAGEKWCRSHNFIIKTGSGSNRAQWGEKRY